MKKLSVVVIAILALAGSLTAYSSLIPKVPVVSETDDLTVSDAIELTSSLSSSEETSADELTDAMDTDADSMSSSTMSLSSSSSTSGAMEQKPSQKTAYLAYADGIIGNGETSLLFFHASWCSSCKQADTTLKALYSNGTPSMNTYRINYDTALVELKKRYGITQQHTFVLIDGKGTVMKTLLGATSEELTRLLR